jgi:hypothetical protein
MASNTFEDIEIDQKIFKRIAVRVFQVELDNSKTKKLRATEMFEKIRKIIEIEVNKNDD